MPKIKTSKFWNAFCLISYANAKFVDLLKGLKMSKPVSAAFISKKNDTLGQALALLEVLQSQESEKIVRISSELSEILADERNFEQIKNATNLDELLAFIEQTQASEKMLRVPCSELLREDYPTLAKNAFL